MRKVFFTLGGLVLVAVAAAVYFITFQLDAIVETQIEKAASIALGSKVDVGGVTTNIRAGTLTVERVSVANPPGFENPYAVQFNAVEAAVNYDGLEIKRLIIENPEFIIEEKNGRTNFEQMLEALEAEDALDPGTEPTQTDAQLAEPVIVIRHFRINETRAAFESHSFNKFTDVKIDAIEMNDLRGTPSELAEQIARKVVGELSSEASSALLKSQVQKQRDGVQEKLNSKLRGLLGGDDEDDSSD